MSDQRLLPLLVVSLLVVCAVWVLYDARARAGRGRPVGLYVGNLHVDTPEAWAIGCLVIWVLAFPLYLKARSES